MQQIIENILLLIKLYYRKEECFPSYCTPKIYQKSNKILQELI